jgi:hypothetical protein
MKKAISALAFTAFVFGSVVPAFAADSGKPCKPAKEGYVLNDKGECVKAPDMKKK